MFNQQKYVNEYIKEKYKTIKFRVRYEDKEVIEKLNEVDSINKYLLDLVKKDIRENRKYNYINNEIKITFECTHTMQDLIDKAEEADRLEDYGLYMNMAMAIDSQAKKEVGYHILTEGQWNKLLQRYEL